MRTYDQLAVPIGDDMSKFIAGTQITIPHISKMNIGTLEISESVDLVPQTLRNASVSVTPTSRGETMQQSELLRIQNYAENFEDLLVQLVAENAAESIDLVAQGVALKGGLSHAPSARASLDAGTTTDNFTDKTLAVLASFLSEFKATENLMRLPSGDAGGVFAIVPNDAFYDLRAGGNIVSIAQYQDKAIILNNELGEVGGIRIIKAPWAKTFGAAGADNASNAASTLSAAANKLATTIVVASATNHTAGRYLTIGTEETGSTHYETNERVKVASASGTTLTIVGQGSNNGLRFDHASGVATRNADSVYPVVVGYVGSLAKWFDPATGEFGKLVLNERQGLVKQWVSQGWKWYGQYARTVESRLARGEFSSSLDA